MQVAKGFRACAEWPPGTASSTDNITKLPLESKQEASIACRQMEETGLDEQGEVFPVRTWLEPITPLENYNTKCFILHQLIKRKLGASKEAEELRDIMDEIWQELTPDEQTQARDASARFAIA